MIYDKFMDAIENKCADVTDKIRFYHMAESKLTAEQKEQFYDSLDDNERILFMSIFEGKICEQDKALLNLKSWGKALADWRRNYLILCSMNDDERYACFADILSNSEEGIADDRQVRFFAENLSIAIIDLANNYKYFEWEKSYFTVINSVWKALGYNNQFVNVVEYRLQNIRFLTYESVMRNYFDTLLEKKAYAAASNFFDKIYGLDDSFSDMSVEEIKCTYLVVQSPKLVWKLKKLLAKIADYSTKNLYEDVLKYNKNEKMQKWVEMNYHIENLKHIIVDGEASEDSKEYVAYIQNNNIEMFDTEFTEYMTELLKNYISILNYVIENRWNVGCFLDLIDSFNLLSYRYIIFTGKYSRYGEIRNMSLISKLEEELWTISNPEILLKIYMNTHLKFCIEFNDVVRQVYHLVESQYERPKEVFGKIFEKYVIAGKVIGVSKNSLDNKLKICPQIIFSRFNEAEYENIEKDKTAKKDFFEGCIKSQSNWVYTNKREMECFENGDKCDFVIAEVSAGNIFAKNIVQQETKTKEKFNAMRDMFADKVIAWLKEIQTQNKMLSWFEDEEYLKMSIQYISDYEKREEVAMEILRTFSVLTDSGELKDFCREIIGKQPYEKFNDCRYIRLLKYSVFRIKNRDYVNEINKLGKKILSSKIISSTDKTFIYRGTCLKTHFWLEDAEKFMPDVLTIDAIMKNNEIEDKEEKVRYLCPVIPVVVAGWENGKPYFSTRKDSQNLVFRSRYKFVCDTDIPNEVLSETILLRMKNVNHTDKIIHCVYVDEQNEKRFDEVNRAIYDIKRKCNPYMSSKVKKQITKCKDLSYEISEVAIFAHELEEAFRSQGNDMDKCLLILDTLEEVNPFMRFPYKKCEKRDVAFYKELDMHATYESLLEQYREEKRGFRVMCRLYFETYYKWLKSFDEFLTDIGGQDIMDEVMEYLENTYH